MSARRFPGFACEVLPGGKAVLFNGSIQYGNFDEDRIAVVSRTDHRKKIVLEHAGMYSRYLPSGHLIYVTKGALFAVPFDIDTLEVRGPATLLQEVSSDANLGFAQLDFSRSGTLAYRTGRTEILRTVQWLYRAGKTESNFLQGNTDKDANKPVYSQYTTVTELNAAPGSVLLLLPGDYRRWTARAGSKTSSSMRTHNGKGCDPILRYGAHLRRFCSLRSCPDPCVHRQVLSTAE